MLGSINNAPLYNLTGHSLLTIKAAPESPHRNSTLGLCDAITIMYVHIPRYTQHSTSMTTVDWVRINGNTKQVTGLAMLDNVSVR